ncbi:MAG TPA: hypothetical protein VI756_03665 [Blastocatellia bacterium]
MAKLRILGALKPAAKCGICGKHLYRHMRSTDCPQQGYDDYKYNQFFPREKREQDDCPLNADDPFGRR